MIVLDLDVNSRSDLYPVPPYSVLVPSVSTDFLSHMYTGTKYGPTPNNELTSQMICSNDGKTTLLKLSIIGRQKEKSKFTTIHLQLCVVQ